MLPLRERSPRVEQVRERIGGLALAGRRRAGERATAGEQASQRVVAVCGCPDCAGETERKPGALCSLGEAGARRLAQFRRGVLDRLGPITQDCVSLVFLSSGELSYDRAQTTRVGAVARAVLG